MAWRRHATALVCGRAAPSGGQVPRSHRSTRDANLSNQSSLPSGRFKRRVLVHSICTVLTLVATSAGFAVAIALTVSICACYPTIVIWCATVDRVCRLAVRKHSGISVNGPVVSSAQYLLDRSAMSNSFWAANDSIVDINVKRGRIILGGEREN